MPNPFTTSATSSYHTPLASPTSALMSPTHVPFQTSSPLLSPTQTHAASSSPFSAPQLPPDRPTAQAGLFKSQTDLHSNGMDQVRCFLLSLVFCFYFLNFSLFVIYLFIYLLFIYLFVLLDSRSHSDLIL
jgi:hypothetical protein